MKNGFNRVHKVFMHNNISCIESVSYEQKTLSPTSLDQTTVRPLEAKVRTKFGFGGVHSHVQTFLWDNDCCLVRVVGLNSELLFDLLEFVICRAGALGRLRLDHLNFALQLGRLSNG